MSSFEVGLCFALGGVLIGLIINAAVVSFANWVWNTIEKWLGG